MRYCIYFKDINKFSKMEATFGTKSLNGETYDPNTYMSFQKYINNNNGFLNFDRFEEHLDMIQYEEFKNFKMWEEVIGEEGLFNFKKAGIKSGDRIRYIAYDYDYDIDTNSIKINRELLLFRTGGFVIKVAENYLCYKSHGNSNISIQDRTINRLFVLRRLVKLQERKPIMLKKPITKSKFSVFIGDVQIADFETKYKMERFMKTNKYHNILNGARFDFVQ